jgi:hypothetical protein
MKNCIPCRDYNFDLYGEKTFELTFGCGTVKIYFHESPIRGQAPPSLVFAQNALSEMHISSLAYGIVCIKDRIAYVTNEVLTSKHECIFDDWATNLDIPRQLANCRLYGTLCSICPPESIFSYGVFFVVQRFIIQFGKMRVGVNCL